MRVMVMGDIHGAVIALEQCLERSRFDKNSDILIQLGDVVDVHPDVHDCVETLLSIKNLVAIKGNHDDWFLEFIRSGYHPVGWNYGGKATAISYLRLSGRERLLTRGREGYKSALDPKDIPLSHRRFFESQALYHIDAQNNCYVHGGFNRHLPFTEQRSETFYWDRDLWTEALYHHTLAKKDPSLGRFYNASLFNEIYIGHTPTMNWGTDKPLRAVNILNMDTGAGWNGKLTIMDVQTKKYWQSDPVHELYSSPEKNARG